ncbi:MAG TPA: diacylglycerol kinase family protein [Actinomycetota bacterium]|nr:diacylglycerol kinase family protein [Actinomycetota bacterium]
MRLLLIANMRARSATPRRLDVITRALASGFDVRVVRTERPGHASELAREADADAVAVLGGDGTVNEAVNGLVGTDRPLAILPGGGANVFARALGIPEDPVEATSHLLERREMGAKRVPLGRADDRYFTFSCGFGLDAAIVRRVEQRQRLKKAGGQMYYLWSALSTAVGRFERRRASIRVRWGSDLEHVRDGLHTAVCQKADPYTYLGERAMRLCPQVELYLGLDMLGLHTMRLPFVVRTVASAFSTGRHIRSRQVLYLHDEDRIELVARRPLPAQLDGEYVGERGSLLLEAVPDALAVLA